MTPPTPLQDLPRLLQETTEAIRALEQAILEANRAMTRLGATLLFAAEQLEAQLPEQEAEWQVQNRLVGR